MNLGEFISARLDEAERGIDTREHDSGQCDYLRGVHLEPGSALRDIAAKRAIVADCLRAMSKQREFNAGHARCGSPYPSPHANLAFRTLLNLAAISNDHPDYLAEWAPES